MFDRALGVVLALGHLGQMGRFASRARRSPRPIAAPPAEPSTSETGASAGRTLTAALSISAVLAAASSLGCYGSGVYGVHTTGDLYPTHFKDTGVGFLEAVRASAAIDLQCRAQDVTPRKLAEYRFVGEGCGRRLHYTSKRSISGTGETIWFLEHDVYSTDGTPFTEGEQGWLAAAQASGAHDLHCAATLTPRKLARYRANSEFLVDGCGQRATYASDGTSLLLTSVVVVEPRAPATGPGRDVGAVVP